MTDVLLIQSPISFTNKKGNFGMDAPLGISYVAASLKKAGIRTRAINNSTAAYSIEEILQICEADKIRIVGIAAVTPMIRCAVKLARAIKDRFGDRVHIVLGNTHVLLDPDVIRRYPYFDSAIGGEAELTMVEHSTRILQGEKPSGFIKAAMPMDLDALPFPDIDCVENKGATRISKSISIMASRGCPFKCGYCCIPLTVEKMRMRSAANIVDEMELRMKQGHGNEFYFNDDAATIKKSHVLALCQEILQRKVKMRFMLSTRIDSLDEEMVSFLKRAGCISIMVGIESGNERIRNEVIGKNLSDAKIIEGMRITHAQGMPVQYFMMYGHPEETASDMMDTVEFPLRMEKLGFTNIEMVGHRITMPIPGTRYFDWCLSKGKISPAIVDDYITDKLGDGFYMHWPYLVPEGMTLEQLFHFRELGNRRFFLRPSYIRRRLWHDIQHPSCLLDDMKSAYYVLTKGVSEIEVKKEAAHES